jgi:DNA-binding beta-propeller fold protein YncE
LRIVIHPTEVRPIESAATCLPRRRLDTAGRLYLIAGRGALVGVDGIPAVDARLIRPVGLALDFQGNLFIAEAGRNRIRKIDLATGIITTAAGQGGELKNPSAIAHDNNSQIVIADTGNHRVVRLNTVSGVLTTVAGTGTPGFSGDGGPAVSAQLNSPTGVTLGRSNHVYVADSANDRIREINSKTSVITTLASVAAATIAADNTAAIYSVSRVPASIERIDPISGFVSHWVGNATTGFAGDLLSAYSTSINTDETSGLVFDGQDGIWLADSENFRIRRMIMTTGVLQTVAGTGAPADGGGLAADRDGHLFVADSVSRRVSKVDAATGFVSTAAGGGPGSGDGDGFLAVDASRADRRQMAPAQRMIADVP